MRRAGPTQQGAGNGGLAGTLGSACSPLLPQLAAHSLTLPLTNPRLQSITDLDGAAVADSIMAFSEDGARCADPARFRADMDSLFTGMDHDYLRTNTTQVRHC